MSAYSLHTIFCTSTVDISSSLIGSMARKALLAVTLACMALMASAWGEDNRRGRQRNDNQGQWGNNNQGDNSQPWLNTQWQQQQPWQNNGGNNQRRFTTRMNGAENGIYYTQASGQCTVVLDEYAQQLTGTVTLVNIKQVTGVHLHLAPRGQTGDKVAWLWPSDTKAFTPQPFDTDRWTVSFTITANDIIPAAKPFAVNNFGDFARAMKEGNIYVNVHTKQTKDGEIRGQLFSS